MQWNGVLSVLSVSCSWLSDDYSCFTVFFI